MIAFACSPEPSFEQVTPASQLHAGIAHRWSPYGFARHPVQNFALASLFEAARWAAAPYEEQPWTCRVASRSAPEEFERLLSCLMPANRQWARAAPVLVLNIVSRSPALESQDNRAAVHEFGLAAAHLARLATSHGLCVHQVLGILPDRARELYGIPEHFAAWSAMAIGYDEHAAREPVHARYPAPTASNRTGELQLSR